MEAKFTFHPVGQGLFYSGQIKDDNEKKFNFVYDCGRGNYTKAPKALEEVITSYKTDFNITDSLDLLTISHFHNDHINGIEFLLSNYNDVKRVVIPYLSHLERLFLASSQYKSFNSSFSLIIDPVKYLQNKKVKEIYIIPKGTASNGLLTSISNDEDNSNFDFPQLTDFDNDEIYIGNVSWFTQNNVFIIDSKKTSTEKDYFWIFRFYNPFNNPYYLSIFEKHLKNEFVNKSHQSIIDDILKNNLLAQKLRKAYDSFCKEIKINFNETSILLYHSPPKQNKNITGHFLTGDKTISSCFLSQIENVYKEQISNVYIFQVPHHGSIHSWNSNILNVFNKAKYFVANGSRKDWKHPHEEIASQIKYGKKIFINCNKCNKCYYFLKDMEQKSFLWLREKKLNRILKQHI
jgi:hypothetical protein